MNTSKLRNENTKLWSKVRTLTKELEKLRASQPLAQPADSSPKVSLDNISRKAKQRAALRLKNKKENLLRGAQEQIRRKFRINLSKQKVQKEWSTSSIQTQIEAFLCRDDVSKLCSNKGEQIDGHQIRYRLNHLNVLHEQFELETNIDVDYATFTRYVPSYIKRPNHECWGTCLCMLCLNSQIKYEKMHQLKNKHSCIKSIVDSTTIDLYDLASDKIKIDVFKENLATLNTENIVVTFCEWQKKKKANCVVPISTKATMSLSIKEFVQKFIAEIDVSDIFYK